MPDLPSREALAGVISEFGTADTASINYGKNRNAIVAVLLGVIKDGVRIADS